MTKSNFEFIQRVHARFIYARILAGRPDVHSGKEVRERWMILPERNHAAQQIGAPQDRAVFKGSSADDDVAAASSGVAVAAEVVFLRDESIFAGFAIKQHVDVFEFVPITGGRKVDFKHTGVGSDAERAQSRIGSRSIALYPDGHLQIATRVFNGTDQIEDSPQEWARKAAKHEVGHRGFVCRGRGE